ncbi:MAG: ABC transporter ATP-binding protein [Bifidobacterium sp.]|uniref:ABC-type quaternary amine transporter n=1 Tax=Bifidobacterium fermentum TaxID=3059035 RepID=A0AB39UB95_9BIFI
MSSSPKQSAPAQVPGESVTFSNVTKAYGGKEVLHAFNLEIKAGEMVSLLGPSGCGKSTALRCLSGFESISEGSISIGKRSVVGIPPQKRGIGMVFQQYSLFPNMSVIENVAFGLKIKRTAKDERLEKARAMLDLVGLQGFADAYPSHLSGGQQQRVALARAIVVNPQVLLLDEPLSALDAKIRVQLRDEIRALQRKLGITAIFVTHDQEEALAISDRVAVMHDGDIEQIGVPKDLYLAPKTSFVADFVGQTNRLETAVIDGTHVDVCGTLVPLSNRQPPKALVRVFVRPENVMLEHGEDESRVAGTVMGTSFLGSIERTTVSVGPLTLVAQHDSGEQYSVGEHVGVSIRPQPVISESVEIPWVEHVVHPERS